MLTLRMRAVLGTTQHDDTLEVPLSLLRATLAPERVLAERIAAFAEYVDGYERVRGARVPKYGATIGFVAWTVESTHRRDSGHSPLMSDGGPLREQIIAGLARAIASALRM